MSSKTNKKQGISLPAQMLIGLGLGVVVGLLSQQIPAINVSWLKPVGDLFIRLIRMIVVPLVFCSIVSGAASMGSATRLGKIAVRCFALFMCTTAVAVCIGLLVANITTPGAGIHIQAGIEGVKEITPPSMTETILNIVPLNPIDAMAQGNLLQVLFFAVFFGFMLSAVGEKAKLVIRVFDELNTVMITLTGAIMKIAPIAVFALICYTVGTFGLAVLLPLLKLVLVVYLAALIQISIVYIPLVKKCSKLTLKEYFKIMAEPLLLAFTTCSSAAALPANMRAANKLGASEEVASFAIPLGTTVNMDGAALYLGIASIFVAEVYGMPLDFSQQMTVLVISLLASIGSVGVPGSALIVMTMVFTQVGLPMEGIVLVAGVDRILDMARTTLNVMGDSTCALVVSNSLEETDHSGHIEKIAV